MASFVENVNKLASDLSNDLVSDITTVAGLATQMQEIVDTVIPNINEILLADDNAVIATTKALEALTSANNADTSEANALTYSNNALTSANNADISEANALSYKNSAETSATTATTKASNASASAVVASAYANINWAGFRVADGELIVTYASGLTSTPSIVDGDFIITY